MAEKTTDKTKFWTRSKKVLFRCAGTVNGILSWRDWRNATTWRHSAQIVFVLLNIYLCAAFYLWVRHFETGATGAPPMRPEGVEGWLPIAGLMNLKYTLVTWEIPQTHTAAMILLVTFLLIALFLKKSFCSWLCPVGTLSEMLWRLGKRAFKQNIYPPRWLDIPLRSLKYVLMVVFLYLVITMPAETIAAFMITPYGTIADVKMLNFFRFIGATALITIIVLMTLSVVIPNFWCRYLCPYGALLGWLSLLSPFKVRRDADACIDCGKCAKVCPARLPMDRKPCIRSAECTACLSCVEACPARDALQFSLPPKRIVAVNGDSDKIARRWRRRKLSGIAITIALLSIIGCSIGAARLTGYWHSQVPEWVYQELIPRAQMLGHP
ncbi:MAG: 4Fe-4S binding protein [Burkholderiales bacterium]|jgi:polyferredoxin|nr:4Fe-4S binding protein [Burkholderiales bacterium]